MARPKQMKTLAQWRVERGLTVQALAELLGESGGSLEKYLSGKRVPSVVKAYRIAAALGVDLHQISDWQVGETGQTE